MEPVGWRHSVQFSIKEQTLHRNVKRFLGGLVFKAHRLVYQSTLPELLTVTGVPRSSTVIDGYRGTSPIRNTPPPQGHHRALDTVLLLGPGEVFLSSGVPLYVEVPFDR